MIPSIRLRAAGLNLTIAVGLLLAGAFLSAALGYRVARAQDDWDVPKKPDNNRNVFEGQWTLPNFDQWVLQGRTRVQIETAIKQSLALQMEAVGRACQLTATQREKLQLAGELDVKRTSRAIDELREKFNTAAHDQNTYSRLINEGSTMQMALQSGIYGEASLFQKVVHQTLTREQSLGYERQERERRRFRYQAKVELVLSNLEGSISLTADERQQLVKLVVEETEPPKKFGQYDTYFVFVQLGKLPEAKLKSVLDDGQRKSLKKLADRFRGMEQTLKMQGYM
jgi:hypothetical protein